MSKPVTVKVNPKAVEQLLRHPNLKADLERRGKKIMEAAGGEKGGFESHVWEGHDRSRGQVTTATNKAKAAEARNRVLARALSAGR